MLAESNVFCRLPLAVVVLFEPEKLQDDSFTRFEQ